MNSPGFEPGVNYDEKQRALRSAYDQAYNGFASAGEVFGSGVMMIVSGLTNRKSSDHFNQRRSDELGVV